MPSRTTSRFTSAFACCVVPHVSDQREESLLCKDKQLAGIGELPLSSSPDNTTAYKKSAQQECAGNACSTEAGVMDGTGKDDSKAPSKGACDTSTPPPPKTSDLPQNATISAAAASPFVSSPFASAALHGTTTPSAVDRTLCAGRGDEQAAGSGSFMSTISGEVSALFSNTSRSGVNARKHPVCLPFATTCTDWFP